MLDLSNYTVMVTGAGGFLGAELIKQLIDNTNTNIIALTSKTKKLNRKFISNNKITINSFNDLYDDNINWPHINIVIHLAFARSQEGRLLANSLNITKDLMILAYKREIEGFINISSQGVYGQSNKPMWKETTKVDPDSLYALAKYSSELLLSCIKKFSSIHYVTNIRLPGLTGGKEGLKPEIVSRFVNNVIRGKPIHIVGGHQIFSNMDVRDAASGIIALLKVPFEKWDNIYNLGHEKRYSIMEIAEVVKKVAPKYTKNEVIIEIEEKDIYLNSGMDSTLFYETTGWKPKYDLEATVESIFDYFIKKENNQ